MFEGTNFGEFNEGLKFTNFSACYQLYLPIYVPANILGVVQLVWMC